jgi:metal-responsive CopG/Arc/MetJ family transcriptional regulator
MEKIMKTNILLPETLWEQAKIRATMERVSLTEIIRRALREYLGKSASAKTGRKSSKQD